LRAGNVSSDSRSESTLAAQGARALRGLAVRAVEQAIAERGADAPVEYPGTAYSLPAARAWTGREVRTLADLKEVVDGLSDLDAELDSPGGGAAAGETAMLAAEAVEALKYLDGASPYEATGDVGFIPDGTLRGLGVSLVDDTIPGAALLVGEIDDIGALTAIVRDLRSKGVLILASGPVVRQLREARVQMGPGMMLFPLGDGTAVVHAIDFAVRAALSFGAVEPGDRERLASYLAKRPKVIALAFGPIDPVLAAVAEAAALNRATVVTDQKVDGILSAPHDRMVLTAMEASGMKAKPAAVSLPTAYGPAYEGESIRRPETHIEAGGPSRTLAFELLRSRPDEEVEDGKVVVIGPEADEMPEGSSTPLAILVDVHGRRMQEDFEPVLERRIHIFVNYAEGAWHTGQRSVLWFRMSRDAVKAGLRLRHLGEALVAKLKEEFGGIVSRVQVTIVTDREEAERRLPEALEAYASREARTSGLTDESVDTAYSCLMCQSFAPDHVCIILPERVGLCGAINWLDARAAKEIDPNGPNQPVPLGEVEDAAKGSWSGINQAVREASHRRIERMNAYTMMEDPMTSCGCFEVIVAMTADAQGVIVVNREHAGMTPIGMKFSALAGSVGGGRQTPGFIGAGRKYLISRKFIMADGGLARVAWMPRELKESMRAELQSRADEIGVPGLLDMIADETTVTDAEGLMAWMAEVGHPALAMPPLVQ